MRQLRIRGDRRDEIDATSADGTRIGNRVFMTTSHARKASGNVDRARYKFAAFDLGGNAPTITPTSAGTSSQFLDQLVRRR